MLAARGCSSCRPARGPRSQTGWAGTWRVHHWINLENEPSSAQPPVFDHAGSFGWRWGRAVSARAAALLLGPPDVEYKLLDVPPAVLERSPAESARRCSFELDRQMPWPAAELGCTPGRWRPTRVPSASAPAAMPWWSPRAAGTFRISWTSSLRRIWNACERTSCPARASRGLRG